MDVSTIINLARDQTGVNATQFSDAQVLSYLNLIKNNFWSYLVSALKENYNWDIFRTSTVVNQDEYVFPLIASDTAWVKKLHSVWITYSWEINDLWLIDYTPARLIKTSELPYEWNHYVDNQSETDPIYHISDNSIFIAPAPSTAITNWIKITWVKKIIDYEVSTTESNMVIPVDYHDTLLQGVFSYMYQPQGKKQEAIAEKQEYIRMRKEAVTELIDRYAEPFYATYPWENNRPDDYIINPY